MPTIVASLHDYDVVPPGSGPRSPDGLIRRLTSAIQELNFINTGHGVAEELRQFTFQLRCTRSKKARAVMQNALDCFRNIWIVVTQDVRGEGGVIVDVPVPLRVPDIRSLSFNKNDLRACCPVD